jgi:hypothetical protein
MYPALNLSGFSNSRVSPETCTNAENANNTGEYKDFDLLTTCSLPDEK